MYYSLKVISVPLKNQKQLRGVFVSFYYDSVNMTSIETEVK